MLPPSVRIYMATKPVNMNKSFDGLLALIEYALNVDASPFSGHLFVFRNRRGDKVKILFWDRGGFWIFYKRLERGTFKLPSAAGDNVQIEAGELALLLEGIDLAGARRRARFVPRVLADPPDDRPARD
jgi:transposase